MKKQKTMEGKLTYKVQIISREHMIRKRKNEEEAHLMEKTQIIRMAKEIIALDVKRDELAGAVHAGCGSECTCSS